MGKYSNSKIHDMYSDWHWSLVRDAAKYKRLYVADIDRLWIEYDFSRNAVIAVMDIKWEDSGDGVTATENGIYQWFEEKGTHCYIVYIARDFSSFRVVDFNNESKIRIYKPLEYADWLLALRNQPSPEWEY